MRREYTPKSPEVGSNVTFIDQWLALHPGRVATKLIELSEDTPLAQFIDILPIIIERRAPAPRFSHPRLQGIIDKFGIDLSQYDHDVWKRPETD